MKYIYFVSFQLFIQKLSNNKLDFSGFWARTQMPRLKVARRFRPAHTQVFIECNCSLMSGSRDFVKRWENSNIAGVLFTGTLL